MTNQEIFNTVVRHFKKQKRAAIDEGGSCVYRGPNNTKCAFGILIPEEEYQIGMEFNNARCVIGAYLPEFEKNVSLIEDLQNIHDSTTTWLSPDLSKEDEFNLLTPETAESLKDVAKRFNLDASEVDWA